jgi:hypothetical protein
MRKGKNSIAACRGFTEWNQGKPDNAVSPLQQDKMKFHQKCSWAVCRGSGTK